MPQEVRGVGLVSLSPILMGCISAVLNAAFALQLFDAYRDLPPPHLSLSPCLINHPVWSHPGRRGSSSLKLNPFFLSPFHPSEEAELTSPDPQGQSPSQPRPASHSISRSLIHCSFFWVVKSKPLHLQSPLSLFLPFHAGDLPEAGNPVTSQEGPLSLLPWHPHFMDPMGLNTLSSTVFQHRSAKMHFSSPCFDYKPTFKITKTPAMVYFVIWI